MKLLTLHKCSACIHYKNSVCSFAAVFILFATIFTIIVPFYIVFYLFNDVWSQYKIIYEQPDVKFQHKYIFVAEHIAANAEDSTNLDSKITICTSFKYLNEVFDDGDCSLIKFWEKDSDFNQRSDQMTLQLTFRSLPGYTLHNFNLFLEFDAKLNRECSLQIPAAALLHQIQIPLSFQGGEIYYEGQLKLVQKVGFYCPFFLRRIISHFQHNIAMENSTDINDYEISAIRRKLTNNPAYMSVDTPSIVHWNRKPTNEYILNINLNIDETATRYHTSYWQRMGQIWIQYLSFFIVCAYAVEKLKNYLFSRQLIKAWEIIPWKKIY